MSDILCVYYSRTGNTKAVMEKLAKALDAEVLELDNGVNYDGLFGYIRAGMQAMRRSTHPLVPFKTEKKLEDYKVIVIGTPVWAGRCSAPVRAFLKRRGLELKRVAYVLIRDGSHRYESVFDQMDLYTAEKRMAEVSLTPGDDVSFSFWREKFMQEVDKFANE